MWLVSSLPFVNLTHLLSFKSIANGNLGNIPEGSTEWVCLNELICEEVNHIIDHEGYTMEVFGKRKFVTDGA